MNNNTVYRLFVEKLGGTSPSQFVGNEGEIFYDPNIKSLKFSLKKLSSSIKPFFYNCFWIVGWCWSKFSWYSSFENWLT